MQHRATPSPQQTIHSSNPRINALVTSFINTENQLNQQRQQQEAAAAAAQAQAAAQQAQQNSSQKSNNAAIISLLNSGPAPMTSSAVATPGCSLTLTSPQENVVKRTDQAILHQQPTTVRKAVLQSASHPGQQPQHLTANRILNHTNLIAVSPMNVNSVQQMIGVSNNQQSTGDVPQTVRVTMSALATQLASPPAIISTSNLQQNFQFSQGQTQTATIVGSTLSNPNSCNKTQQQQLILNSTNAARILNQANAQQLRQGIASPSSDISNASSNNSSSGNIGFTMTNIGALLASSSSPISGEMLANSPQTSQQQNSGNSALIERLTSANTNSGGVTNTGQVIQQSQQKQVIPIQSPGSGPSPIQFTAPSPKQIQQIQVQSPAPSISPLSSPPPQQALSLQSLNLASLQGAIQTIPGLQNVQVQTNKA